MLHLKKLKNTLLSAVVISFFLLMNGCTKDLNLNPQTSLTDAAYWKTPADLKAAANYLYTFLPGAGDLPDNMSDLATLRGTPNSISDGSRITPATSSDFNNSYVLIRACNTILEKAPSISGDPALINISIAEARFFRGWAYFNLMSRFGSVPLILRTFDVQDTLARAHKAPRATVLNQIYSDLDFAVSTLPDADAYAATDYGRVTQGAALAFKSRVALFEGTRQKSFSETGYAQNLQVAVTSTQQLISGGKYGLYNYAPKPDSSYFYLFQYAGEGRANKENMLVRIYGVNAANSLATNSFGSYMPQAYTAPTRALLDNYLYTDGLPKTKSPLYKKEVSTLTEFGNRDPRASMTVFNRNSRYLPTSNYVPSFVYSPTGYIYLKYYIGADVAAGNYQYNDLLIIRYAEVLLNYAEALYELNGFISDTELNASINLLRARAKMPALTNAFVSANGLSMRDEIRRERTTELALEGFRYWDLIRWKTAETELPKALIGRKYFPLETGTLTNPTLVGDSLIVAQTAGKRTFNIDRDYLWPFPSSEVAKNPNMTQNPYW